MSSDQGEMKNTTDPPASPAQLRGVQPAGSHHFSRFAARFARKAGHIVPFILAMLVVILWLATGPVAHWSDTWQLVMNSISSAVTFLMVFVIQGSQNRDTDLLNAKLNEIIRSLPNARQEFLSLEGLSESQLQLLNAQFALLGRQDRIARPEDRA
jgi:low affinity Fe/Cu permease